MSTSISGTPADPPRESVPAKPALDVAGLAAKFVPTSVSVSPETYRDRLMVCASCIYRVTSKLGLRCACCGCFLLIKAKLQGAECPQEKW